MAPRLGVSLDAFAILRQARRATSPDPVEAAVLAELAGADQLVFHLREDRRHVQERDIERSKGLIKTELNLQISPTQESAGVGLKYGCDSITFVAERHDELTSDGGLDLAAHFDGLQRLIRLLKDSPARICLSIDPEIDHVRAAHKLDAHAVEIHVRRYCEARGYQERSAELAKIQNAAKTAQRLGLGVGAGHGVHYKNVGPLSRISEIVEINVGHAIAARAMAVGIDRAVRDMSAAIRDGSA